MSKKRNGRNRGGRAANKRSGAIASSTELEAKEARAEQEIFDELASLCVSPGFIHAIAFVCLRDYMVGYSKELTSRDLLPLYSHARLIRTEVSTLIGLMAREEISFAHPGRAAVETYISRAEALLKELHAAMIAPWRLGFREQPPETMAATMSQGTFLREPIFYGGESAHSFQYRDLTPMKYAADSDWLVRNKGLQLTNLVAVLNAVCRHRERQHLALARTSPETEGWSALPALSFSAQELATASAMPADHVASVLDALVFERDWRNEQFRGLADYNETNAYPIFRDDEGRYVVLQYQALAEALYETPFYWMSADKDYKVTALKNRGAFAEEFATQRLQHVFGEAHVFRGVRIFEKKGSEIGEIDTLVAFGDRAIVLQAKSKRLTIEARKGNDLQLKADFKLAVQEANDQAYICADALRNGSYELRGADGGVIALQRPLKEIFPLCIVSDHYPALAFQAGQFLTFKTDDVIKPPLVTDVFALDAMTEMLDSPLRFLSYLRLRARFRERVIAPNEFTLLSYHLKRNLWLGDEFNLYLGDDIAVDLDVALAVRRDGVPGEATPEGILTRFRDKPVGKLMLEIEASPNAAAMELGLLLTELSEDTLDTVDDGLTTIVESAVRDGQIHDFSAGFSSALSGVTIYCASVFNNETRMRIMAHCEARKHICRANSWFGIMYTPDAQLRAVLKVEYPWAPDPEKDALTAEMRAKILARTGRPGRNDRCPCGSGLKFKKCCIDLVGS